MLSIDIEDIAATLPDYTGENEECLDRILRQADLESPSDAPALVEKGTAKTKSLMLDQAMSFSADPSTYPVTKVGGFVVNWARISLSHLVTEGEDKGMMDVAKARYVELATNIAPITDEDRGDGSYTLLPRTWLAGDPIDYYLEASLASYKANDPDFLPRRIHLFGTHTCNWVANQQLRPDPKLNRDKPRAEQADLVLVPYNQDSNHWFAMVFFRPHNHIYILDSIKRADSSYRTAVSRFSAALRIFAGIEEEPDFEVHVNWWQQIEQGGLYNCGVLTTIALALCTKFPEQFLRFLRFDKTITPARLDVDVVDSFRIEMWAYMMYRRQKGNAILPF